MCTYNPIFWLIEAFDRQRLHYRRSYGWIHELSIAVRLVGLEWYIRWRTSIFRTVWAGGRVMTFKIKFPILLVDVE